MTLNELAQEEKENKQKAMKQEMINELQILADGGGLPKGFVSSGFCYEVGLCCNFLSNVKGCFNEYIFETWEHYADDTILPVEAALGIAAYDRKKYYQGSHDTMYDINTKHGKMRRNLAGHCANFLTEHFNEWNIYERYVEEA